VHGYYELKFGVAVTVIGAMTKGGKEAMTKGGMAS
jgi:hypothetical protein